MSKVSDRTLKDLESELEQKNKEIKNFQMSLNAQVEITNQINEELKRVQNKTEDQINQKLKKEDLELRETESKFRTRKFA